MIIPGEILQRIARVHNQTMISSPPRGMRGSPNRRYTAQSVLPYDESAILSRGACMTTEEFPAALFDGQRRA
jgi:hypothetical protein